MSVLNATIGAKIRADLVKEKTPVWCDKCRSEGFFIPATGTDGMNAPACNAHRYCD